MGGVSIKYISYKTHSSYESNDVNCAKKHWKWANSRSMMKLTIRWKHLVNDLNLCDAPVCKTCTVEGMALQFSQREGRHKSKMAAAATFSYSL